MPKYYTKKVGKRTWYLNREGTFYYFSLKPKKFTISSLPKGKIVKVSKRTGMPYLKNIK